MLLRLRSSTLEEIPTGVANAANMVIIQGATEKEVH